MAVIEHIIQLRTRSAEASLTALSNKANAASLDFSGLERVSASFGTRLADLKGRMNATRGELAALNKVQTAAARSMAGPLAMAGGVVVSGLVAMAAGAASVASSVYDMAQESAQAARQLEALGVISSDTMHRLLAMKDGTDEAITSLSAAQASATGLIAPLIDDLAESVQIVTDDYARLFETWGTGATSLQEQVGLTGTLVGYWNDAHRAIRDYFGLYEQVTATGSAPRTENPEDVPMAPRIEGKDLSSKRRAAASRREAERKKEADAEMALWDKTAEAHQDGYFQSLDAAQEAADAEMALWDRVAEEVQRGHVETVDSAAEAAEASRVNAVAAAQAWGSAAGAMGDAFDSLADRFPKAAGALFAVSKALAIAQIGVATAVAVMQALSVPPPAGPIIAAAYIATGVANAAVVAASAIGSAPKARAPGAGAGSAGGGGGFGGMSRREARQVARAERRQARGFAAGTTFDEGGLALLHPGEQVVPRGGRATQGAGGSGEGITVVIQAGNVIGPRAGEALVDELRRVLGSRGLRMALP